MIVEYFNKFDVTDDNWGEVLTEKEFAEKCEAKSAKIILDTVRKHGIYENLYFRVVQVHRSTKLGRI